jgi:hypothetical protein
MTKRSRTELECRGDELSTTYARVCDDSNAELFTRGNDCDVCVRSKVKGGRVRYLWTIFGFLSVAPWTDLDFDGGDRMALRSAVREIY